MTSPVSRVWAIAAVASYPLAVHGAVTAGRPAVALVALLIVCLGFLVVNVGRYVRTRGNPTAVAAFVLFNIIVIASLVMDSKLALQAVPVLVNLLLMLVFGRTLLPGREPLITRFHRVIGDGEAPADIISYTRALTAVWTAVFAVLAVLSIALAVFASHATWSLFTNGVNYLVVGALFVGEYFFRKIRLGHYAHPSPLQFAGSLLRADWTKLSTN